MASSRVFFPADEDRSDLYYYDKSMNVVACRGMVEKGRCPGEAGGFHLLLRRM